MLAITGVQVAEPTFCCTNLVSRLVCQPREGYSVCAQQSITAHAYKASFHKKKKRKKEKEEKEKKKRNEEYKQGKTEKIMNFGLGQPFHEQTSSKPCPPRMCKSFRTAQCFLS